MFYSRHHLITNNISKYTEQNKKSLVITIATINYNKSSNNLSSVKSKLLCRTRHIKITHALEVFIIVLLLGSWLGFLYHVKSDELISLAH